MPDGSKSHSLTNNNKSMSMKKKLSIIFLCISLNFISSCNVFKKPKEGCPSNGKNVGAEKLLGGEKVPKVKRFRD